MANYFVYLLLNNDNHTYIGITNNLNNRLEKHNSGKGAKATRKSNTWKFYKVYGLFTKSEASSFEWYCKHQQSEKTGKWRRTQSGIENKINHINKLLEINKWKDIKEIEIN
jgi:putative endonuclease